MTRTGSPPLVPALFLLCCATVSSAAPPKSVGGGDHLVLSHAADLVEGALPRGPLAVPTPFLGEDQEVRGLSASPADASELFVLRRQLLPFQLPRDEIVVVDGAGGIEVRGEIFLPPAYDNYEARDLAFAPDGTLYALYTYFWWNPPESRSALVEVDPSSGAFVDVIDLANDSVHALASTRSALWALSGRDLFELDPETGQLGPTGRSLPPGTQALDADGDSTGAIWLLTQPVGGTGATALHRLDPATGSFRPTGISPPAASDHLAVRRRCAETPNAICLQGGRFQIEADWRKRNGETGIATATANRSADSAVLWFFDPSNWELIVKLLDNCGGNNPRYWVFAAGTTNVEYTLRVTDLETDETNVYPNPSGQTAITVTDTNAFATCP